MSKKLRVAELFAGVGGFRYAFEEVSKDFFQTVYANQYEPLTKKQHAFEVYEKNFKKSNKKQFHDNKDIKEVNELLKNDENYIKSKIDLVVGGFPCQDYSVATTKSKGIEGKKGVLFWEIENFIKIKKPSYLFLENVDRLLISPKSQRGRDFLIMLKVLDKLDYIVEWLVVNAADYGFPQRRKRVMIFAYKIDSKIDKTIDINDLNHTVLTKNLNVEKVEEPLTKSISRISVQKLSDQESFVFKNYGYIKKGKIFTQKTKPIYSGKKISLEEILEDKTKIDKSFFLDKSQQERIFKLKDGGKKERITKEGYKYKYSEGKMSRFDNYDNRPGRTMLTSEGTINRSTHIIKTENNKYRFITPIEAERLNQFPDNWTDSLESKNKRYFMMGNALVIGVIKNIAEAIKYYEEKK